MLSVLRPGHWDCSCSGDDYIIWFENHWRWWQWNHLRHMLPLFSNRKRPEQVQENAPSCVERASREEQTSSYLHTTTVWGEHLHSVEACTSRAASCWLKAQGCSNTGKTELVHSGPCPDLLELLKWPFSLWPGSEPIPYTPLSHDLNPVPVLSYRFSQNKTPLILTSGISKGVNRPWQMFYVMESSEHHRIKEEEPATVAIWGWNCEGWALYSRTCEYRGQGFRTQDGFSETALIRGSIETRVVSFEKMVLLPSTQVTAHSSLSILDPKYSE